MWYKIFFWIVVQLHMHYINQNRIPFIQYIVTSGKVLTYVYVYLCKSYVYICIYGGHTRPNIIQNHNTNKVRKYYDYISMGLLQSKYILIYVCLYTPPKSLHIFTTHTHCHQRLSFSDQYLFISNTKKRQWDTNLNK